MQKSKRRVTVLGTHKQALELETEQGDNADSIEIAIYLLCFFVLDTVLGLGNTWALPLRYL